MLVLAIGLAVAAAALAIWWLNSLNGLPDIGDPFDVAAFRAFSIPDDQNAFTFLRRASESSQPTSCRLACASETTPRVPRLVEANRPAVELFIKAAECADGISGPAASRQPGGITPPEIPLQAYESAGVIAG